MKNILILIFIFSFQIGYGQERKNTVFGVVSDGYYPLDNVNIQIKGTNLGTTTNKNGEYQIQARPQDILVFSYVGMLNEEIIVEDVTKRLNIELRTRTEQLDEVIVTKKIDRKSQDYLRLQYGIDKDVVNSSFGFIDKKRVGYHLKVIDGDDLSPAAIDILTALQGRVAGLRIGNNGQFGDRALFIRGGNSISNPKPAVYDVDGMLMTRPPLYLSIHNIDRVAIMPSLASTVLYGNIAAGSVILVNTKGSVVVKEPGSGKPYDRAKLRGNIYTNDALDETEIIKNSAGYIKSMHSCKDLEEAKMIFNQFARLRRNDPYYFIDSYLFFHAKGDESFAKDIIDENSNLYDNPVKLKVLAYALDVTNRKIESNLIYQKVFSSRPKYAQSYRDLANSFREISEYRKAVDIYSRYQYLVKKELFPNDSTGIQAVIEKEFKNLLKLKGSEFLNAESANLSKSTESNDWEKRILIEWSDSEAEFKIQFVNPENHYFTWEHSTDSNLERIMDEKKRGYSCQEFFLDKSLPGKWQINLEYKGNKKLTPTYLKLTFYSNYNKPSQQAISRLFRLNLENVNQKL
ncbi:MAG: carboxypeptidase-like regulatory domain-containing protein, partial [Bacteroidota bacterium]